MRRAVIEILYVVCARRAQRYVRAGHKIVTYTNIRLSTNDQLIFLPSAKRGVDKKLLAMGSNFYKQ